MGKKKPKEGDLQVWWIPQFLMKAFHVSVASPKEAAKILIVLGEYDLFQYQNKIKPDYCSVGGLNVFENGEWVIWYDDKTRKDIDELINDNEL